MTNPFATAVAATPAETPAVPQPTFQAPPSAPVTTEKAASPLAFGGNADPFADPTGVSGEYISSFVGRLLVIRPTELIPSMETSKGTAVNVVRVNLAVLDDATEPGRVVEGVLLMQMALKREAKIALDNGNLILGRLHKREEKGKNTLYTFQKATEEERALAEQWRASGRKI